MALGRDAHDIDVQSRRRFGGGLAAERQNVRRTAITMVANEDIAALHPALQPILRMELDSGNKVVETWRGWPAAETVCVALGRPFLVSDVVLPADVVLRSVDDPHYWKAEYEHRPSRHLLVCRF